LKLVIFLYISLCPMWLILFICVYYET